MQTLGAAAVCKLMTLLPGHPMRSGFDEISYARIHLQLGPSLEYSINNV